MTRIDQVLASIDAGNDTARQIADATGMSMTLVCSTLCKVIKSNEVARTKHPQRMCWVYARKQPIGRTK